MLTKIAVCLLERQYAREVGKPKVAVVFDVRKAISTAIAHHDRQ